VCQPIGSLPSLNVVRPRVPSPIVLVDSHIQLGLRIPASCRSIVVVDGGFFGVLTWALSETWLRTGK
jgi:hypothetical protein